MENVKQILDELDDGYKYFAIKKDGSWYRIEFDAFMVQDIQRAQNICSELNQMLENACDGKQPSSVPQANELLPLVSARFPKKEQLEKEATEYMTSVIKETDYRDRPIHLIHAFKAGINYLNEYLNGC